MKSLLPSRLCLGAAFVLLAATPAFARDPRSAPPAPILKQNRPAPQIRPEPRPETRPDTRNLQPQPTVVRPVPNLPQNSPQREEHLERWMQSHSNLSLQEQQRALQGEPGFRELPPKVQQNRLNMLGKLYNMSPQQRGRMLSGVEGLERLSPQQQQQWDRSVQQLHGSAVPRRSLMIHAIADLREMPPEQRQQVINSPRFAGEFTPEERQTISTILTVYPAGHASDVQ